VDAECADKLTYLPSKNYRDPDEVVRAFERLAQDWAAIEYRRDAERAADALAARAAAAPKPTASVARIPRTQKNAGRTRIERRPAENAKQFAAAVAAAAPPRAFATRAGQYKTVGEGLAVGLLALGVEAITINEWLVRRAFDRAWQKWAPRARFPAIRSGFENCDIVLILRGSARRKGPHVAVWGYEGEYTPKLCVDRTIDGAGDAVGWRAGVTYEEWVELGTGFVAHLKEDLGEIRYRASRESRSA
jgi:hypothetical protein